MQAERMHGNKTISLDLKAYERLRQAREFENESFSQVILARGAALC